MCSGSKSQSKDGGLYQLMHMVQYCAFVCLVEANETAYVYVAIEVMRVCRPAVLGKILANMQCAILSCPL